MRNRRSRQQDWPVDRPPGVNSFARGGARQQGTERPFANEYWNHHADGVYFSVCSETPLFDSRDKFDSGTGWPSFTKAIQPEFVGVNRDTSHAQSRVTVRKMALVALVAALGVLIWIVIWVMTVAKRE